MTTGPGSPGEAAPAQESSAVDGRKHGWMLTKYGMDYHRLRPTRTPAAPPGLPLLPAGTRALARPPWYNVASTSRVAVMVGVRVWRVEDGKQMAT